MTVDILATQPQQCDYNTLVPHSCKSMCVIVNKNTTIIYYQASLACRNTDLASYKTYNHTHQQSTCSTNVVVHRIEKKDEGLHFSAFSLIVCSTSSDQCMIHVFQCDGLQAIHIEHGASVVIIITVCIVHTCLFFITYYITILEHLCSESRLSHLVS